MRIDRIAEPWGTTSPQPSDLRSGADARPQL